MGALDVSARPIIEDPLWLAAVGAISALGVPLLVRWRLRRKVPLFVTGFDLVVVGAAAPAG